MRERFAVEHFAIWTLLDIAAFLCSDDDINQNDACIYYRGAELDSWYHRIQIRSQYLDQHGIDATMDAVMDVVEDGEPVLCSVFRPEKDSDLLEWIAKRQFPIINPQTAMFMDLRTLGAFDSTDVGVIPSGRLPEWSACCAQAFSKQEMFSCFEKLSEHCSFYGYQIGGEITSTLMLNRLSSLAGLHEVGTKLQYRGKGQATKLVNKALSDERNNGCTMAVLQASSQGYPLYRRLGFEDCGFLYNFHCFW